MIRRSANCTKHRKSCQDAGKNARARQIVVADETRPRRSLAFNDEEICRACDRISIDTVNARPGWESWLAQRECLASPLRGPVPLPPMLARARSQFKTGSGWHII